MVPTPVQAVADHKKKTKAAGPAKPPRRSLTDAEIGAIGEAYLEKGLATDAVRRFPGLPKTTVYSVISRRAWEKLGAGTAAAAGSVVPAPTVPPPVVDPPPAVAAPSDPSPPAITVALTPVLAPAPRLPSGPAPRPGPRTIEAEQATPKTIRNWLQASLQNGGVGKLTAEDKVAAMTHDQALQQANIRRIALRLPPFVFVGAKA